MRKEINKTPQVAQHMVKPDGNFPNNPELPVLHYKAVFNVGDYNLGDVIEKTFNGNNWGNSWRNGIFDYHHYHSITHEAIGVYKGHCRVQVGGPDGIILELMEGDVLLLPAGVAHKNVGCAGDFKCVGAYPDGRMYDICYGKADEKEKAKESIQKTPLPATDPIYGEGGILLEHWMIKEEVLS